MEKRNGSPPGGLPVPPEEPERKREIYPGVTMVPGLEALGASLSRAFEGERPTGDETRYADTYQNLNSDSLHPEQRKALVQARAAVLQLDKLMGCSRVLVWGYNTNKPEEQILEFDGWGPDDGLELARMLRDIAAGLEEGHRAYCEKYNLPYRSVDDDGSACPDGAGDGDSGGD